MTPPKPTLNQSPLTGPVFLVGCPRSGTTLLQRMLDAHPDVAVAPETHFVRRFWLRRDWYGDLRDDAAFARLIRDVTAIPEFADMQLGAEQWCERAARAERTYAAVFWLLLEQFATRRGARLAGEKTPNHLLYMPALQRLFPAARFIHLVRDARAVANSWRHVPWSTGSVAGDAEVWRRYLATARRRAPAEGTISTLHYEDLVLAPEATIRGLCDFLRLDFDSAMLAHEKVEPHTINLAREPWKMGAVQPLGHEPVERWRRELEPGHVREIEAVAWAEMRRAGYRTETRWNWLAPRSALHLIGRSQRRLRRRLAMRLR